MHMIRLSTVRSALAVLSLAVLSAACAGGGGSASSSSEPWGTNTVDAAALVKELSAADKPVVVCTAPPFMYRVGHIPGAVLHGPASEPSGLNSLTTWAESLPRSTNIVIYCGCCPLEHCPNLKPAYKTLKTMGFTRLRVLILPDNFGVDWMNRGYPTER
jgi:thiosulfate/3-mercaptopyruvate sulfurtransferase